MKYILFGFPKCGQHSIIKKYKDEGQDIHSYEGCWRSNAVEFYEDHWGKNGFTPVFVKRNVFDFLLSGYNYWPEGAASGISFRDYLYYKPNTFNDDNWGIQNPIERSDFMRWIKPFFKYSPIIHEIEQIPIHEHKTKRIKTNLNNEDVLDICVAIRKYAMRTDEFG